MTKMCIQGQSWRTQGHKHVTVNATGYGFDPHSKKRIFSFLCSGVEVKCSVEFRHSTRNAPRIWRKVWNKGSKKKITRTKI